MSSKIIMPGPQVPILGQQVQWAVTPGLKFIGEDLHQLLISQPGGEQKWMPVPREIAKPGPLEAPKAGGNLA